MGAFPLLATLCVVGFPDFFVPSSQPFSLFLQREDSQLGSPLLPSSFSFYLALKGYLIFSESSQAILHLGNHLCFRSPILVLQTKSLFFSFLLPSMCLSMHMYLQLYNFLALLIAYLVFGIYLLPWQRSYIMSSYPTACKVNLESLMLTRSLPLLQIICP